MSDDYEDDFEAYESDFESEPDSDLEPPAVLPIIQADSLYSPPAVPAASAGSQMLPSRQAMGLSDAQRALLASRWHRWLVIRKRVVLSETVQDALFVMEPLSQHKLLQMGRGRYRKAQSAQPACRGSICNCTQTGADEQAAECQTDAVSISAAACQVPDDLSRQANPAGQQPATLRGSLAADRGIAGGAVAQLSSMQGQQLAAFVRSAGATMTKLLLQHAHRQRAVFSTAPPSGLAGISAGAIHLRWMGLDQAYQAACLAYDTAGAGLLLVAYAKDRLAEGCAWGEEGCACVWSLERPAEPAAVLLSEGQPAACCLHSQAKLACIGMQEGGICLWDLTEPDDQHSVQQSGQGSAALRRPSFTTEAAAEGATAGAITGLQWLPETGPEGAQGGRQQQQQLISLTAFGHACLWAVARPASATISTAEAGLRVGSVVQLLCIAPGLQLGRRPPPGGRLSEGKRLPQQTAALALLPGSSGRFLAGCSDGRVLGGCCTGQHAAPQEWRLEDPALRPRQLQDADPVTCHTGVAAVACCPSLPGIFATGDDAGRVAVFNTRTSIAVLSIQVCQTAIVSVQWVPNCPALLLVLDVQQTVFLCNLRSRSLSAVLKFKVAAATSQPLLQVSSGLEQCSFAVSLGGASIACHAVDSLLQSDEINQRDVHKAFWEVGVVQAEDTQKP